MKPEDFDALIANFRIGAKKIIEEEINERLMLERMVAHVRNKRSYRHESAIGQRVFPSKGGGK